MTSETREVPEVLSFAEAAKFLGISERTLRRWVAEKIIPHAKVGGLIRFRRVALREWLEAAEKQTMAGGAALKQPSVEEREALTPEEHAARVDTVAGKYAWVPTSVDDFIRRKQEEIDLRYERRSGRRRQASVAPGERLAVRLVTFARPEESHMVPETWRHER